MMLERLSVLVTAIGGSGYGEQILKALQIGNNGRYRIFGADMNPNCPQLAKVDVALSLPPARHPEFIDVVLSLCHRHGIRALFHGCEPELLAYSKARARFAAANVLLLANSAPVLDLCMDKIKTAEFLTAQGFSPPRFRIVETRDQTEGIDWFPLVVKPFVGGGGSKDCFIAQTPDQLHHLLAYMDVEPGRAVMVQEYVGTPDDEYTVGVLHDLDGAFINSIAVHRELKSLLNLRTTAVNRTGRAELGKILAISSGISHGHVGRYPNVTEPCEKIAAALGARGPINIQGRLSNGEFKVFEINPRFSGTTSIRAMMGYNEPDLLLRRHIFGETLRPRFLYREGTVLRSLTETVVETGGLV